MEKLRRYPWPGNVRELENLVLRLAIMDTDGVIGLADLPDYVSGGGRQFLHAGALGRTLEDMEREVILKAIEEAGGNKTRAAERLDISTRTIRNKLKKYVADGYVEENHS
jgi:DNA-binding NtrC family response regulator